MPDIEKRFYPVADTVELRQDGDERVLTWVSPPYDRWSPIRGDMQEMIARDAFADSTDDVIATVEHDNSKIFARVSAGTLKIEDRDDGAHHEARLGDRSYERDLVTSIERGEITGASFEFVTLKDEWEKHERDDGSTIFRRKVLKARRLQGGPVAQPFYDGGQVALRSLEGWRAAHEDIVMPGLASRWYQMHLEQRRRQMESGLGSCCNP